uniref:Putative secreted protein n=1 Tax=Xenopsylla cheopis TaxID=163159 RepID=A0A6M2E309_XENCH
MTSIPQLSISFFRFSILTALCRVLTFHVPNLRGPVSLLSLLLMTRPGVPSTRRSEREGILSPVYFTQGRAIIKPYNRLLSNLPGNCN